jgi:hypothetical protein
MSSPTLKVDRRDGILPADEKELLQMLAVMDKEFRRG